MNTDKSNSLKLFATLIIAAMILVSGTSCNTGDDPLMAMLDTQLSNVKIDSLTRTMNFVVSPQRFEKSQFEEKLAASLNRWGEAEKELLDKSAWKPDSATGEILKEFAGLQVVEGFDGIGFVNTDSYYLQQNYWARKLAERIVAIRELGPFEVIRVESKVDEADVDEDLDPLAVALEKVQGNIDEFEAETLSKALKCFDWVARNIMLLSDNSIVDVDGADELKLKDAATDAESGIPGLGYTRFPAQTMLTSRGDYVDRAKVFITMLNQLEIDSVMLMVDSDDGLKPWAVGVFIGKELCLFDTKLGLPIPGKNLGAIATLTELRENPDLLKSLDLSVNESLKENTKYWVDAEKLNNLTALVYCPPEAISYRFWELENKLVGDTRMNLTVAPSQIIKKMSNLEVKTGIWDVEFQTHQFRRTLRDAIAEASFKNDTAEKIRWYYADEFYINEFVRYRTARSKYFHGLFETIRNDGNLNAIELFYNMIYKDSKIDSLATDKLFQQALSINQGKMAAADFEKVIKGVQANMRLVRRDSGFFLSQCHFDNGNFSTSANWLTRLENIEDTRRWQQAINYLKARSLEAQRDYASAVEIYKKQDSEHFHGDMIRVRQLQKLIDTVGTLKKEQPQSDESDKAAQNKVDEASSKDKEASSGESTEGATELNEPNGDEKTDSAESVESQQQPAENQSDSEDSIEQDSKNKNSDGNESDETEQKSEGASAEEGGTNPDSTEKDS